MLLALREQPAPLVLQVQPVLQVRLVPLDRKGLPGPRVSLVRREQPDPLVPPDLLDSA